MTRTNGTATNLPAAVQAAYDVANEQIQFNSAAPNQTFDANGNLTNDGINTYTYDARNRLVGRNGPGVNENYAYDLFGRRISKTINGVTTSYLYDRSDIVQEIGGSSVEISYVRSLSLDEHFVRQTVAANEFYHADAVGSSLALSNASGASTVSYSYEAFGKTTMTGTSSNPFQYVGRENDSTGLYYYRARYYSPSAARFFEQDPRGFQDGFNPYVYVRNNPINFTDPLGLKTYSCTKPLKKLGSYGPYATPNVLPGSPAFHQFLCVDVAGRSIPQCGGQDLSGGPYSPGTQSDDVYNPAFCEPIEPDDACLEDCLRKAFAGGRPFYGLIGPGTNCQEWVKDVLRKCRNKCRKQ